MSEISRRRFLAGAAAGAAASAASFAHAAAAPADLGVCKLPAKWDESYELVVIGSGGAGLATAVSASQNGVKKILVLEKMSYIGGNTAISGGGFNSYDPVRQGKQNIKDSPENHAKNTLEGGDGRANPELVNEMTKNSYDAVKWLESMGMKFKDEVYQIYGGLWPRGHYPAKGKGIEYIKVLEKRAKELGGIDIRTNARVTGIVREKFLEGRVLGVEYADKDGKLHYLRAKRGVVAAAGGCCANGKMCGIHDPRLEKLTTTNIATASTGEILTMMEDLGAMTTGLDFIQCNPGCPPGRTFRTNFHSVPAWMIMVDKSGKRFVAEDARRDVIRDAILNIQDQTAFAVQDSNGFAHDAIGAQRDNKHALTTGDAWTDDTIEGLAKKMGVPVGKLICASNCNDVLTDFIRTGVYDRNRPFHTTMSPSMDILISSNLERMLFELSGEDDGAVRGYMDQLKETGRYEITGEMKEKLQSLFYGGFATEEDTLATITALYADGYLIDTHTAVAAKVLADYRAETGDDTVAVFASTASPYKFCDNVLKAIGEEPVSDSVARIAQLEAASGVKAPVRLSALKGKTVRFDAVTEKDQMECVVLSFLK